MTPYQGSFRRIRAARGSPAYGSLEYLGQFHILSVSANSLWIRIMDTECIRRGGPDIEQMVLSLPITWIM